MSNVPPIIPLPVQPLEYTNPYHRSSRPGILTAVGVMSIVIACLSFISSLSGIGMALVFVMMGTVKPAAFPPPAPTPVTAAPPTVSGGLLVVPDQDGLPVESRAMIIEAMRRRHSLSASRQTELHLLLAQAGKKIFPGDVKSLTPAMIRGNITEVGNIPGVGGGKGSTYFIVGTGRIEVFDDHAVFRPDGSADVVSVSAGSGNLSTTPAPAGAPSTGYSSTYSSTTTVVVNGKSCTTTTGGPTTPPVMMPKVSVPAAVTQIGENITSGLLAIFLLIAGILVLRDSPKARRMHWIYALVKMPLVIVAAIVSWWVMQGFMASMTPGMPRGMPAPFFAISAVFGGLIALAYPVALLIVLPTRSVKEYYTSLGQ